MTDRLASRPSCFQVDDLWIPIVRVVLEAQADGPARLRVSGRFRRSTAPRFAEPGTLDDRVAAVYLTRDASPDAWRGDAVISHWYPVERSSDVIGFTCLMTPIRALTSTS
jgi:hypothetical protein